MLPVCAADRTRAAAAFGEVDRTLAYDLSDLRFSWEKKVAIASFEASNALENAEPRGTIYRFFVDAGGLAHGPPMTRMRL